MILLQIAPISFWNGTCQDKFCASTFYLVILVLTCVLAGFWSFTQADSAHPLPAHHDLVNLLGLEEERYKYCLKMDFYPCETYFSWLMWPCYVSIYAVSISSVRCRRGCCRGLVGSLRCITRSFIAADACVCLFIQRIPLFLFVRLIFLKTILWFLLDSLGKHFKKGYPFFEQSEVVKMIHS